MPEREVGDGHVVHDQVELLRAVGQLVADTRAHGLTLAQQLLRVVLGHHGLQHLRAAVVVVVIVIVVSAVYEVVVVAVVVLSWLLLFTGWGVTRVEVLAMSDYY